MVHGQSRPSHAMGVTTWNPALRRRRRISRDHGVGRLTG